jgi:hypothetical protein
MNTAEAVQTKEEEPFELSGRWESITSSQMEAINYSPDSSILLIRFKGGSVYRYDGVPEAIVSSFREAASKGTFFGKNIKQSFPYRKIDMGQTALAEIIPVDAIQLSLPKLEEEVLVIVEQAKAIKIATQEDKVHAIDFCRVRKSVLDSFIEWFAPIKKASWDAHKQNTEKEKSIVQPNELAISIVKKKILEFDDEQERRARVERERIRQEEELKERARREREEAERKERQRIEDEKRAIEDARLKAEREKLEADKKAQADALARAGRVQEAERVAKLAAAQAQLDKIMAENKRITDENARLESERQALERMSAPIIVHVQEIEAEHTEGQTNAYAWIAEVKDIRAFCRGIAEGKTPIDTITINQRKINALAKTWKGATGDYHPGLTAKEDKSIRIK